jgi:hypothetical protein
MTLLIIGILAVIWVLISAFILVMACMYSSQLSQSENISEDHSSLDGSLQGRKKFDEFEKTITTAEVDPIQASAGLSDG